MTNTQTIAAILASQTPIGTRYAVPGTELTDARCPLCDGPHTLTQCAEWAGGPRLIEGLRAENAKLRADLDDAHQHVGALVKSNREMRAAMQDYAMDVDEEPPYKHREMMAQALMVFSAARAWLRRRG